MKKLFRVGQKVKISFKAESFSGGWEDEWLEEEMDSLVGKTGYVREELDGTNSVEVGFVGGKSYFFPNFCLQKVERG